MKRMMLILTILALSASCSHASLPSTPFLINGHVFHGDGTLCNGSVVNITNTGTYEEWQAETSGGSNYYQIMLANGTDLNASEILRFNVTNGTVFSVTEHPVTADEVDDGGVFDYSLTLGPANPAPHLVIYTVSNTTISPDGDGIMDDTDIDVEFSEKVKWKIAIENGGVVHDWTGTSTNPTKNPWNGTYEGNGTIVPDGTYTVNITWTNTTTDLGGQNNTERIVVDTTPPAVIDHAPTGTGAPVSTNITATFDETVNPDTLNNATVTVEHNGTAVAGNVSYDAPSKTVTFDPAGDLNYSETYNTTITTGVQDIAGNNMSSNVIRNFTTSSRATEATISIGNVSGNVTVPITIENAENVGSAHINITYNASVCVITDVANGTFDWTFANLEHNETGWVSIGAVYTEGSSLCGSIVLANVTFRRNSTNDTSPLNLSVVTFKDATNHTNPIPYIVRNGTYTAVLNGDVNGDGVVDIADAMYLAKHVLVKSGFEELR